MGGAKKRSLAQSEKQQTLQTQKQEREQQRKKKPEVPEKKVGGISLPSLESKDLATELSKMKAITPYAVASKYSLRLSMAKTLLKTLEKRGLVQLVTSNTNLRLYRFAGSSPA